MKKILKFMSMTLVSSFLMSVGGNSVFAADPEPKKIDLSDDQLQSVECPCPGLLKILCESSIKDFRKMYLSKGWEFKTECDASTEQIKFYVDFLREIHPGYSLMIEQAVNKGIEEGKRIVLSVPKRIDCDCYMFILGENNYLEKAFSIRSCISLGLSLYLKR